VIPPPTPLKKPTPLPVCLHGFIACGYCLATGPGRMVIVVTRGPAR